MKASVLCAVLLSASLAACGGGGSAQAPDNSAAIQQAMGNINPGTLPYAMVYANGAQLGYVKGDYIEQIATNAAKQVQDSPNTYPDAYRALVSAQGLAILVKGDGVKVKDQNYVAKLGAGNVLSVVFVGN